MDGEFGSGLANVTKGYWEWLVGVGNGKGLLAVLEVAAAEAEQGEIQDGRFFDEARGMIRARSFSAARVGAERVLVVVG